MKISIAVFQSINNNIGSSSGAQFAYNLSKYLNNKRIINKIYFSQKKGCNEDFVSDIGKAFYHFDFILNLFERYLKLPYYIVRFCQEIMYDLLLYRIIRQDKTNITTFITFNPWLPLTTRYLKRKNVLVMYIAGNQNDNIYYQIVKNEKKILSLRGKDPYDFYPRLKRYNGCMRDVDKIICVNEIIAQSFIQSAEFRSKVLINNYFFEIDPSQIKLYNRIKNSDHFVVGYLAISSVLKGLHILLEAWKTADLENSTLLIAGKIELNYHKVIKKINKDVKNVVYLGHLTPEEKINFYNKIDVFVCPSLQDAGPTTILEALLYKRIVIASNGCGNISLIKEGINGAIYDKHDSNALANKLKWIKQSYRLITKETYIENPYVCFNSFANNLIKHFK